MPNTYPYKPAAGNVLMTVNIANVSSTSQVYVVPGFNGRIRKCSSALNGAITVADATLTLKINNTAVTNGAITITQSGSAAGDVDQVTPTGANVFDADDAIEIEHGGSTTAQIVVCTL